MILRDRHWRNITFPLPPFVMPYSIISIDYIMGTECVDLWLCWSHRKTLFFGPNLRMPSENPVAGKAGWKNDLSIDPIRPEKWILPSHNLTNLVPTKHIMHLGLVPSNFLWPQLNVFHNKLECLLLSVTSTLIYHFQARLEPTLMWLHSNGRLPALPANIVPEWIGLTGHLQIYLLAWFDWCKIKMFQFLNYNHFRKLIEIWQFQI